MFCLKDKSWSFIWEEESGMTFRVNENLWAVGHRADGSHLTFPSAWQSIPCLGRSLSGTTLKRLLRSSANRCRSLSWVKPERRSLWPSFLYQCSAEDFITAWEPVWEHFPSWRPPSGGALWPAGVRLGCGPAPPARSARSPVTQPSLGWPLARGPLPVCGGRAATETQTPSLLCPCSGPVDCA